FAREFVAVPARRRARTGHRSAGNPLGDRREALGFVGGWVVCQPLEVLELGERFCAFLPARSEVGHRGQLDALELAEVGERGPGALAPLLLGRDELAADGDDVVVIEIEAVLGAEPLVAL